MRRWWIGMTAVAVLAAAGPGVSRADDTAREEAERLRADMEGQSERLRLTVETFMQQQQDRMDQRLAEQDRRLAGQDRLVWGLGGVCAGLAALSGGLGLAVWRLRRRAPRSGSR